ncbi:uncharacterized protein LOC106142334 [Amyelois transitella]|uniref:uncharacterized protein LOC106142334 n=1 Tax=Amyelois transitella TaxID=680683 RepID=UPI00067D43F3|nr:uncharacterized protein LOC106142334 [Amyelois transitella]
MRAILSAAIYSIISVAVQAFFREAYNHNVDYTPLFMDDKEIDHTVDCLLEKIPCPEYQQHKEWFPFLVKGNCGFCNPIQKARYHATKAFVKEKYPHHYRALEKKFLGY